MQFYMPASLQAQPCPWDHPRTTLSLRPLKCWSNCTAQQHKHNHRNPGKTAESLAQPNFWDSFLPHKSFLPSPTAATWGKMTFSSCSIRNKPTSKPAAGGCSDALRTDTTAAEGAQTASSRTQRRDTQLKALHRRRRFLPSFQVFLPHASGNPTLGGGSPLPRGRSPSTTRDARRAASSLLRWEERAFFPRCLWGAGRNWFGV